MATKIERTKLLNRKLYYKEYKNNPNLYNQYLVYKGWKIINDKKDYIWGLKNSFHFDIKQSDIDTFINRGILSYKK